MHFDAKRPVTDQARRAAHHVFDRLRITGRITGEYRRRWVSLFKSPEFDVSEAENGAHGVKKARNVKPDLEILDLSGR
jgi:hypothetical protein